MQAGRSESRSVGNKVGNKASRLRSEGMRYARSACAPDASSHSANWQSAESVLLSFGDYDIDFDLWLVAECAHWWAHDFHRTGEGAARGALGGALPHRGDPVSYTHLTLPTICSV